MPYEHNKRWREKNPDKRSEARARNYAKGREHAKSTSLPYTDEEDGLILNFEGTDRELSVKIKRSVQAIQIRRSRLKAKQRKSHQR